MRSVFLDALTFIGNDPYIAVRLSVISVGLIIAIAQKLLFDVSVWEHVLRVLDNPYFGATFSIVGIGASLAALQQLYSLGQHFYSMHLTCSMEIPSTDESFHWVLQWIYARRLENPLHFSVETSLNQTGNYPNSDKCLSRNKFDFVPSPGTHNFVHNGKWIRVSRNKNHSENAFGFRSLESLILSTSGRDTSVFLDILLEASKFVQLKKNGKTMIYNASNGCWSSLCRPFQKRPLNSVILDEGLTEKILDDLEHFVSHAEWYVTRGIPFRRGYLLHGPPGVGKTSFIMALAGLFDMNICVLNLSEKWLTDDIFQQLLGNAPQDSIFLLEDVDAAFLKRDAVKKENTIDANKSVAFDGLSRLTFSGFLNAIDGVASAEGRVLFMTTNHIERLDTALLRPGRVDFSQYFGYATEYQLRTIYRRFYPSESAKSAEKFAALALDTSVEISMAQIQGLFLLHKYDPENISKDLHLLMRNNL